MKLIYLLIIIPLFISIISAAEVIKITPSTLSISTYPGETHIRNISIETYGNFAVYLTSNSTANITIDFNETSPIIVERQKTIQVAFTFPTDIIPGVYEINLTGSTEVYVEDGATIISNTVYSISGGGIVYRNGTIKIIDNPKDKELIQELNDTIQELIKIPQETKEIEKAKATIQLLIWMIAIIILLGLIILGIKLFRKDKAIKIEEQNENEIN